MSAIDDVDALSLHSSQEHQPVDMIQAFKLDRVEMWSSIPTLLYDFKMTREQTSLTLRPMFRFSIYLQGNR